MYLCVTESALESVQAARLLLQVCECSECNCCARAGLVSALSVKQLQPSLPGSLSPLAAQTPVLRIASCDNTQHQAQAATHPSTHTIAQQRPSRPTSPAPSCRMHRGCAPSALGHRAALPAPSHTSMQSVHPMTHQSLLNRQVVYCSFGSALWRARNWHRKHSPVVLR